MANDEMRRKAAEREADEALDAILREIDSEPRKRPAEAEDAPQQRSSEQRRAPRSGADRSAARNRAPRRTEDGEQRRQPQRKPRPETESVTDAPKRQPRREAPAEDASARPQRRRLPAAGPLPEERRAAGRSNTERPARPARRPEDGERPVRRAVEDGERPVRRAVEDGERPVRRAVEDGERPARRPENGERPARRADGSRPAERRPLPPERSRAEQPARSRSAQLEKPVRSGERQPQRKNSAAESVNPAPRKRPAGSQGSRSRAAVKRSANMFRIGMLIYIIIFALITMFLMHKLWNYLGEYESSLPKYTIDGYVTSLNSGFYSDMVRQKVDQIPVTEYETPDSISETLDIENQGEHSYTWTKNAQEYTDERPVYFIRDGSAAIATVALERVSGTPQFDFPIWKCMPPVSLIEVASEPQYELDVTVPEGASVMVNGKAIPVEDMQQAQSALKLDAAALTLAMQPSAEHAVVRDLFVAPKVQAFDSLGNELTASEIPDSTSAKQVYVFEPRAESAPDEALVKRTEEMMEAYINYTANKDDQVWVNLGVLDNYLVKGANAYNMLHDMVMDFNWNNPYTDRKDRALEVQNVRMYADNVCTVEVHYDYQLTKNVVNDYIGTMRWTMVKQGNVWNATDFIITQSNDTTFDDKAETDAAATPDA